jgi:Type I phosphodiesterase / nucleotide pyrophosphatase
MTSILRFASLFVVLHALGVSVRAGDAEPLGKTHNVVLVTIDGLRWQEVFRGADASLINIEDGGVDDPGSLRRQYWRETSEARREALMPFLWTTVSRQGQVFGNRDKKSPARVTNGKNFSYPGYNELFTGFVDPGIDSNEKRPNPNVSVLEWLDRKPAYRRKVAAVGSWDVHPFILNVERSGLPVNAGWMPISGPSLSRSERLLNDLMSRSIHDWDTCRNDVFTFRIALDFLRHRRPRVLYVGLGDTDKYGHGGRYDLYLRAAHEADAALKSVWNELQSHQQYRGSTTMIVTTDHGRGDAPKGWKNHGEKVEGSEAIWLAVLGPDTPAMGERSEIKLVTLSQVAATLAALLGEDYNAEIPKASAPIVEVLRPGSRDAPVPPRPADEAKPSP